MNSFHYSKYYHAASLFIALLTMVSCQNKPSHASSEESSLDKPNIIFIMADDLGYADIGPYGQETIQTPFLDQMAREGMLFTQHYAGNTVCAPSRCALMTGMHMGHAEVRGNQQDDPHGQIPISTETVTVAELLQEAGYTTGLIGKWGLGIENTSGQPLAQGFDFYYGYLDQVLAHNYYPEYLLRNGEKEYLRNEVLYQDSTQWHRGLGSHSTKQVDYSHDLFMEETLKFLDRKQEKPFFLYLSLTIPHDNGEAPEGQQQEIPGTGIYGTEDWPSDASNYAAMITHMDAGLGQILAALKKNGLEENTLLLFTSDNGPKVAEYTDFFNSNGPLRGSKRDLYEGGIRVPMLARWPGKIKAGSQSTYISAFWDFLPTACEIAGISPPATDGISFLPELLGREQKQHEYLFWEFPELGYSMAARKGKWKAVRTNMETNQDAPLELYDLDSDLGETNSVAADHPEIVNEMLQIMQNAHIPSSVFPMPGEGIK